MERGELLQGIHGGRVYGNGRGRRFERAVNRTDARQQA